MDNVGILTALVGGLISFVSPCVLPLVPPYLCYIGGVSIEELGQLESAAKRRRDVVLSALSFVLGFSTVFVALGATASVFGQFVRSLFTYDVVTPLVRNGQAVEVPVIQLVAGLVVGAMGLHFLGVFRLAFMSREARMQVRDKPPGLLGGYVLGLAFAFGWTPCIGPILAAILALAGSGETVASGAFLLFVYSLGIGLPFLLAAGFAPAFLGWSRSFRPRLQMVEKVMGAFLVVTGVLFITGQMAAISYWMLEAFPGLATLG
jgi:cytochrome c-type biogenesis protein